VEPVVEAVVDAGEAPMDVVSGVLGVSVVGMT
jgi:hypothetical protein